MKFLILFFTLIVFFTTFGQKLPQDALDSNTVLIFNPDASVDNNKATLDYFTENIIDDGFNLVGRYMFTDSEISKKEIEFDLENKDVKYIFLLTYKFYKEADYDLYYFENLKDDNTDIIDPKNVIFRLKPGFIHTTKDFRGTIIKLLNKQVEKLKEKNNDIDTVEFNTELINTLLLSEENVTQLQELNKRNTLIDGVTLKIESEKIPADLKLSKLAVIATDKQEYRNPKAINSILKSQLKKYPFEYDYFKDYESYVSDGGDEKYKFRLQLTKSGASMLSLATPKYSSTELSKINSGQTNVKPTFSSTPINFQKDLFTVILMNNISGERHLVSKHDFLANSIKSFVSRLK